MINHMLKGNRNLQRQTIWNLILTVQKNFNKMTVKQTEMGRAEMERTFQVMKTVFQKYLSQKGVWILVFGEQVGNEKSRSPMPS